MADALMSAKTSDELRGIEQSIQFVVQHMPTHDDYLKRYCPAPM